MRENLSHQTQTFRDGENRMVEQFLRDGVMLECKKCFPGRSHLVIDYPEGKIPEAILKAVEECIKAKELPDHPGVFVYKDEEHY
jgi:hypothetical protein